MLYSMTGFGRAEVHTDRYGIRVEVRSVNNRTLKVTCRLPEVFSGRELEIERFLRGKVTRGTIHVVIAFEDAAADSGCTLQAAVLDSYVRAVQRLKEQLRDARPVQVETLLALPGVIAKSQTSPHDEDVMWSAAEAALAQATEAMIAMRAREGELVWKDILQHSNRIGALLEAVEQRLPEVIEDYRHRLRGRLDGLLAGRGVAVDEAMIAREVALLADRSDIAEEVQRLRGHIRHLVQAPTEEPACGRKIEFIVQEMFREANTMASKGDDERLLREVLEIKNLVDKLREQAHNVE